MRLCLKGPFFFCQIFKASFYEAAAEAILRVEFFAVQLRCTVKQYGFLKLHRQVFCNAQIYDFYWNKKLNFAEHDIII